MTRAIQKEVEETKTDEQNESAFERHYSIGPARILKAPQAPVQSITLSPLTQLASHFKKLNGVTMNRDELKSLYSLLAYVAMNRETSEMSVRATVAEHFGVRRFEELPSSFYDEVVQFLVDLSCETMQ